VRILQDCNKYRGNVAAEIQLVEQTKMTDGHRNYERIIMVYLKGLRTRLKQEKKREIKGF
jgi:hypothetical protein